MGISYPLIYREVRELVERRVRHTRMARDIVRKSGFRVGAALAASAAPTPILNLPPVVYGTLSAGIYAHPAGLPHYVTYRPLALASEVRISASVTTMAAASVEPNATLSVVYSTDLTDWAPLAQGGSVGVNFTASGFYVSEWETIPDGAKGAEVYIAMSLQAHTAIGALWLGQSEVRIR